MTLGNPFPKFKLLLAGYISHTLQRNNRTTVLNVGSLRNMQYYF